MAWRVGGSLLMGLSLTRRGVCGLFLVLFTDVRAQSWVHVCILGPREKGPKSVCKHFHTSEGLAVYSLDVFSSFAYR